jgi:hypothetical protein
VEFVLFKGRFMKTKIGEMAGRVWEILGEQENVGLTGKRRQDRFSQEGREDFRIAQSRGM